MKEKEGGEEQEVAQREKEIAQKTAKLEEINQKIEYDNKLKAIIDFGLLAYANQLGITQVTPNFYTQS